MRWAPRTRGGTGRISERDAFRHLSDRGGADRPAIVPRGERGITPGPSWRRSSTGEHAASESGGEETRVVPRLRPAGGEFTGGDGVHASSLALLSHHKPES